MQVVRLSNTAVRNELVTSLQEMLRSRGRPLLQHEASTRLLLQRAVTKNKRQHMLAVFFRGVFAEVRASSAASSCLLGPTTTVSWTLRRRGPRPFQTIMSLTVDHLASCTCKYAHTVGASSFGLYPPLFPFVVQLLVSFY